MAKSGSQSSTGAVSTSVTDTAATKERRNLLLRAPDKNYDAALRDTESITQHAGTWMRATSPEASAEAFEKDIGSYFPRQTLQPSINGQLQDEKTTLQTVEEERQQHPGSKRDRIKEWLRNTGPRVLHVTATTAMFVFNIVSLCC